MQRTRRVVAQHQRIGLRAVYEAESHAGVGRVETKAPCPSITSQCPGSLAGWTTTLPLRRRNRQPPRRSRRPASRNHDARLPPSPGRWRRCRAVRSAEVRANAVYFFPRAQSVPTVSTRRPGASARRSPPRNVRSLCLTSSRRHARRCAASARPATQASRVCMPLTMSRPARHRLQTARAATPSEWRRPRGATPMTNDRAPAANGFSGLVPGQAQIHRTPRAGPICPTTSSRHQSRRPAAVLQSVIDWLAPKKQAGKACSAASTNPGYASQSGRDGSGVLDPSVCGCAHRASAIAGPATTAGTKVSVGDQATGSRTSW